MWAFSSAFPLALGLTLSIAFFIALSYLMDRDKRQQQFNGRRKQYVVPDFTKFLIRNGLGLVSTFICSDLCTAIVLYFFQPPMTGVLGGSLWIFAILMVSYIVIGLIILGINEASSSSYDDTRFSTSGVLSLGTGVLVAVFLLGYLSVNYIVTNGNPGKKQLAKLANVTTMPSSQSIPQTDEAHLVVVTQGIAYYKGQQAVGSNGHNLGSRFQTNQGDYTLQSIQHHLYWVAPLDYRNLNQFNTYETPGYVIVDAENPNNPGELVTGYPLHYTPQAVFGKDLRRHIYASGYNWCNLLDPTLEIDDTGPIATNGMVDGGNPYYTVACATPEQQYYGNVVKKILLVDPVSGKITAYNSPSDVPAWVDRIYDNQTIHDYLGWWGDWTTTSWPNWTGVGQQHPANDTFEILYSKVDSEPVYVAPMTSSNGSDQSSTGIMLCHTRYSQCDFYPLAGYGIGSNVSDTFANAPGNKAAHYDVSSPRLVNLFGRLSWVTTYYTSTSYGDIFAGVGIVDATPGGLQSANVVMSQTLSDALTQYQTYLSTASSTSGQKPTANSTLKTMTANVARITSITSNGTTTYLILFQGQKHVFLASDKLYPLLPFIREGDSVTITYNDTKEFQVPIVSIDDTALDAITK